MEKMIKEELNPYSYTTIPLKEHLRKDKILTHMT